MLECNEKGKPKEVSNNDCNSGGKVYNLASRAPDLSHRKTSLSDSPRSEEYALGGTHMLPFTLDSPSEVKAPSPVAVVIGQRVSTGD